MHCTSHPSQITYLSPPVVPGGDGMESGNEVVTVSCRGWRKFKVAEVICNGLDEPGNEANRNRVSATVVLSEMPTT